MKNSSDKEKSGKKNIIIIPVVVLILILLFSVISFVNNFLNKINKEPEENIETSEEFFETDIFNENYEVISPEDIQWDQSELYDDSELLNILVVGQDGRETTGRQRTDSMILLSFNPETNKASMISFLRDMYVQIPSYSDNRLNAAYVLGGFSLMKDTFRKNFGLNIDGCFRINFSGFEEVIDILGGVDIELTEAEAKIVGDGAEAGVCHLDGEHALMYARIRKIDSDFSRTERQRKIVSAVFEKVKDSSASDLLDLINTVLPYLSTDMSNMEIVSIAMKYASSLESLNVSTHHVPSDETYKNAMIKGMAVLLPDLYGIKKELFEEYLPFD